MLLIAACLACVVASAARGQTIFFDGFSGPELHPRWTHANGPNGGDWTYDFANSMFNLRSVTPSVPFKIPWRGVDFHTTVDLPGDFTVTARVGWTAGGPARQIGIRLLGETFYFAELYMDEWLRGTPTYYWAVGPGAVANAPAPPGAMIDLTLQRAGTTVRALIGGVEVASASRAPERIRSLTMILLGDSRAMQPLHVDWIHVIPAPATTAWVVSAAVMILSQRRRCHAR
ncbi:MAG: hypothetical protein FJ255_05680 [Phycisphaerae bacterium]|nr:hypothetical protein [Phycisphaerae bacterium]